MLATLRTAEPWLTARELLDNVTPFLASWIPSTHRIPLVGYGLRNSVALGADYSLELLDPESGN